MRSAVMRTCFGKVMHTILSAKNKKGALEKAPCIVTLENLQFITYQPHTYC